MSHRLKLLSYTATYILSESGSPTTPIKNIHNNYSKPSAILSCSRWALITYSRLRSLISLGIPVKVNILLYFFQKKSALSAPRDLNILKAALISEETRPIRINSNLRAPEKTCSPRKRDNRIEEYNPLFLFLWLKLKFSWIYAPLPVIYKQRNAMPRLNFCLFPCFRRFWLRGRPPE